MRPENTANPVIPSLIRNPMRGFGGLWGDGQCLPGISDLQGGEDIKVAASKSRRRNRPGRSVPLPHSPLPVLSITLEVAAANQV